MACGPRKSRVLRSCTNHLLQVGNSTQQVVEQHRSELSHQLNVLGVLLHHLMDVARCRCGWTHRYCDRDWISGTRRERGPREKAAHRVVAHEGHSFLRPPLPKSHQPYLASEIEIVVEGARQPEMRVHSSRWETKELRADGEVECAHVVVGQTRSQ
jgi:hypothetical protein